MDDDNLCMWIHSLPELVISQARLDGFRFTKETSYPTQAGPELLAFEAARIEWKQNNSDGSVYMIFRFDKGMLTVKHEGDFVWIYSYGSSDEKADALLDLCRKQIPPDESGERDIEVSFWCHHETRGAKCKKRKISCPPWKAIMENYVSTTINALDRLMAADFDSLSAGKLILWHGEPGTGKSHALRSWALTRRDAINLNYIVDPEIFFSNANYMLELLTGEASQKLNLFVAEDTGELLATDAKRQSGQGMSRLLNVCDGLIGQGLRILFLITTNEGLGALHPAITRPGRCFANIGFEAFNESEALEWLASNGVEAIDVPSRSTIAELYSMKENYQIIAQKPKLVGFVT